MKQCIRNKPVRFGLKFWALCTIDGYVLEFDLYGGQSSVVGDSLSECALGTQVVMNLLKNFFLTVNVIKLLLNGQIFH